MSKIDKIPRSNRRAAKGCLALIAFATVFAIVVAIVVVQSDTESTTSGPAALKLEPARQRIGRATIRNTGYYPPVLNLEIDLGDRPRNGDLVSQAGEEVRKIAEADVAGKHLVQGEINFINVTILGPAGKDAAVGRKLLRFTLDATAARRLAEQRASTGKYLNAAREVSWWAPLNDDVMRDYCQGSTVGICAKVN